nr:unnamed protein product [Bos taurus]
QDLPQGHGTFVTSFNPQCPEVS